MKVYLILILVFTLNTLFGQEGEKPKMPTNYHEVEAGVLYRSGQPNRKEMKVLEGLGFQTVINLRYRINDRREIKGTLLTEYRLKMKAQSVDEEDMLNGLVGIVSSDRLVLVHCLHGSDRTGALVACYRMVVQNWSKEDAINEFLDEQYGYNKAWFPNLEVFLQNLDVQLMKRRLDDAIKN